MLKEIVVALDGSDHAARAAELAAEVAKRFDARIHLVHVIPHHAAPYEIKQYAVTEHVDNPEVLETDFVEGRVVTPVKQRLADGGLSELKSIILRGDPVAEVIDYADSVRADMIFAGRRGLGQLEGLLLGSFSSKLAHHANCSVVTVK